MYDLRTLGKVTSIKDQSSSGSCWTTATYSSVKSNLLPVENRDFSENNLKNNAGFDFGSNDGGNELMPAAYLARWADRINETGDVFKPSSTTSKVDNCSEYQISYLSRICSKYWMAKLGK